MGQTNLMSSRLIVDRAYASVFNAVLMPAWERVVRHRDTLKHLKYLDASQWLSPEARAIREVLSLRQLLSDAGEHVPYYREVFQRAHFDPRGVSCRADLERSPLLTRQIVRERYADLAHPAHRGKNLKKGTSGSTGTPLKFEYSMTSECWRQAVKLRGYGWAGYRPGLKTFYYWAAVSGARPTRKIRADRALRREIFVDSMRQDVLSRRAALAVFRKMRPNIVVCYTQSCAQFARWILDENLRDWDDVPVICGAEAVLPGDRAVLAKAFGPGHLRNLRVARDDADGGRVRGPRRHAHPGGEPRRRDPVVGRAPRVARATGRRGRHGSPQSRYADDSLCQRRRCDSGGA